MWSLTFLKSSLQVIICQGLFIVYETRKYKSRHVAAAFDAQIKNGDGSQSMFVLHMTQL